jgi:hypothetical protein
MDRLRILITLIFLNNFSRAQNFDSLVILKSDVRKFFTDTRPIINGNKKYFYLYDKPSNIFPNSEKEISKYLKDFGLDSFFITSDIDFLSKQIKEIKTIIWDSSYIDSTTFLKSSTIDSIFKSPIDSIRRGYRVPVHYNLTFPIFNKDKTICYISTFYWCGRLCGQGISYIFKLIDNQWQQFRIFYGPVS